MADDEPSEEAGAKPELHDALQRLVMTSGASLALAIGNTGVSSSYTPLGHDEGCVLRVAASLTIAPRARRSFATSREPSFGRAAASPRFLGDPTCGSVQRRGVRGTRALACARFRALTARQEAEGPIDVPTDLEAVRQEPYPLPARCARLPGCASCAWLTPFAPRSFEWCTCDMSDEATAEEVYALLTNNYVEDDDAMFRFDYSKPFLAWALQPPGFTQDWHLGVRAKPTGKLVAFITGVPARVRVRTSSLPMAEINFLCVHKKLRSKRLAPVLIKEVTRRVNLHGVWQAAYTAGVVLPKPIAVCRYWHRSLNPKKLIEVGFSRLASNMTMMRTIKFYKLDIKEMSPGVRVMSTQDVPAVTALLRGYLGRYAYAPDLDEADVVHWLLPREGVVYSYVVQASNGAITDFFSFYSLPSTVINNPQHKVLRAAYCYYYVPGSLSVSTLLKDALTCAQAAGFDVFNALDVMENHSERMRELRFGIGDGHLQFYVYNWRVNQALQPSEVGLVLL